MQHTFRVAGGQLGSDGHMSVMPDHVLPLSAEVKISLEHDRRPTVPDRWLGRVATVANLILEARQTKKGAVVGGELTYIG